MPERALADSASCCLQNFALQLEYLEGEFYSCASTGSGLPAELRGGGPASTGCQKANLGSAIGNVAAELAANEKTHVRPCCLLMHVSRQLQLLLTCPALLSMVWSLG